MKERVRNQKSYLEGGYVFFEAIDSIGTGGTQSSDIITKRSLTDWLTGELDYDGDVDKATRLARLGADILVCLVLKKLDLRMKPWFKKTKRDEQIMAQTSVPALSRSAQFIKKNGNDHVRLVVPGVKGFVEIPTRSFLLFKEMITHVANGRSVKLYHSDMELTTQQAADMLNVSRPHLVKLLESGAIPFKKMNKHRRIAVKDLMEFAKRNQSVLKLQED